MLADIAVGERAKDGIDQRMQHDIGIRVPAQPARVGDAPIDILINSAGVLGQRTQRLGSLDYADWSHVLDVNVLGPARVAEALLDNVAASSRKTIVSITSGMGSLTGAALGGFLVGIVSVSLQAYLPEELRPYRDAFVFLLFIAFLLWRPQGLLVRRAAERV